MLILLKATVYNLEVGACSSLELCNRAACHLLQTYFPKRLAVFITSSHRPNKSWGDSALVLIQRYRKLALMELVTLIILRLNDKIGVIFQTHAATSNTTSSLSLNLLKIPEICLGICITRVHGKPIEL